MNLRTIDLNLLVALDALLSERHVTRAANRIGLSQPAMSNALGRLRHMLKDEVLVRTATGMEPTPRALELIGPTRQVLHEIAQMLDASAIFDPRRSDRGFTLRMSDLLERLLLPRLLDIVLERAPKVTLEILHLPPTRTVEALEADEIDLAVSTGLQHQGAIRAETLFDDEMVCLMRRDHPAARGSLSLKKFMRLRHLKVAISPLDARFADEVLERLNLTRGIALNVPHWLIVPDVLSGSDLVAVVPGRFAAAITGKHLVARPLPFATDRFDWQLYWHRRHDGNTANQWLRQQIRDASRAYR